MTPKTHIAARETPEVRIRVIAVALGGILLTLTAIAFGLSLVFPGRVGVGPVQRHLFPAPAVIADEPVQRKAIEDIQRKMLTGASGRLPIDDAMADIAGRGAHAFDPVGDAR